MQYDFSHPQESGKKIKKDGAKMNRASEACEKMSGVPCTNMCVTGSPKGEERQRKGQKIKLWLPGAGRNGDINV